MADSVTIEGLSLWNQAYVERYNKLREVFTNHTKPLYPWMKNFSSRIYQQAFRNLAEEFKRLFSFGIFRKQELGKCPL